MLIPCEDKVVVVTPFNKLFRGSGEFLCDDDRHNMMMWWCGCDDDDEDEDEDDDVDDDHDDCKCGATSGLGNMFETTSQKMYGSRLKPCHAYIYII